MKIEQYEMLRAYMRACVSDFSHAEDHITRVLNIAIDIAQTLEDVDMDALICACLLHDVGRKEQMEDPSRHHAEVGAEKARAYLVSRGWNAAFSGFVADIIGAHSSADKARERGIEAKVLFDADKLDVVGSIGLCRTIAYGASVNEAIYDAHDLNGAAASAHGTILRAAMSDMVYAEKSFFTARARQLAKSRLDLMRVFLEQLKEEALFGETMSQNIFEDMGGMA